MKFLIFYNFKLEKELLSFVRRLKRSKKNGNYGLLDALTKEDASKCLIIRNESSSAEPFLFFVVVADRTNYDSVKDATWTVGFKWTDEKFGLMHSCTIFMLPLSSQVAFLDREIATRDIKWQLKIAI